ncbi:MAG: antibiotic biosynthesis monooxygenase [Chloroflexota bacterium]
MAYVLVQIKFEDFARWKATFDEASALRKSYGSKGVRVFRNADQTDEVTILGEYENMEKARQLFQSQEFRDAIKQAGVSGAPQLTFLDQVKENLYLGKAHVRWWWGRWQTVAYFTLTQNV